MKSADLLATNAASRVSKVFGYEAHLHSILESIPDAMIVSNEHGRIVSFSAAAEAMFGFSEAEIVGENVSALMASPDRECHDYNLRECAETGERKIIGIGRVTTARHRDGKTFPIDLHIGEARIERQQSEHPFTIVDGVGAEP